MSAVLNVYSHLGCLPVSAGFHVYLPSVMPLVLWASAVLVDFHVEDVYSTANTTAATNNKMVTATLDLKLLGG